MGDRYRGKDGESGLGRPPPTRPSRHAKQAKVTCGQYCQLSTERNKTGKEQHTHNKSRGKHKDIQEFLFTFSTPPSRC